MKPKRKFQNSSRQNSPRHWEVSRKRIRKGEGRAHKLCCISFFFSPGSLIQVTRGNKQNQKPTSIFKEKKVATSDMQSGDVTAKGYASFTLTSFVKFGVDWSYLEPRSFFSIS